MAVAFDAKSRNGASDTTLSTTNMSWTHTPVGTPKGVIVAVIEDLNTDQVSGVTYGGTAMTRVISTPRNTTETSRVYLYFLGTGISTGAQTVAVTVSSSAPKVAHCYTVTASADTEVDSFDGADLGIIANPSETVTHTGSLTGWFGLAAHYYGAGAPVTTGLQSGITYGYGVDFGSAAGMSYYRDGNASASSSTYGYTTLVSDDQLIAAVVIKESGTVPQDVSGTVDVVSTTTGDVTELAALSGATPVVTTTTGATTSLLASSGSVAATSVVTGAPTSTQQISGTAPVTTTTSGAVDGRRPVSGTVPVVTTTAGAADIAGSLSVTGTIVLLTTTSGTVAARLAAASTVPVVTLVSGQATAKLTANGAVAVITTVSGEAGQYVPVSGIVTVLSTTSGDVLLASGGVITHPVAHAGTAPRGVTATAGTTPRTGAAQAGTTPHGPTVRAGSG